MADDGQIDISLFRIALWHFEQAALLSREVLKLAIQSRGFADLAEKYYRLVWTDGDKALFCHPVKPQKGLESK